MNLINIEIWSLGENSSRMLLSKSFRTVEEAVGFLHKLKSQVKEIGITISVGEAL